MEYYFSVGDIAGNVDKSKIMRVDVDITPPVIVDLNYDVVGKYMFFDIFK